MASGYNAAAKSLNTPMLGGANPPPTSIKMGGGGDAISNLARGMDSLGLSATGSGGFAVNGGGLNVGGSMDPGVSFNMADFPSLGGRGHSSSGYDDGIDRGSFDGPSMNYSKPNVNPSPPFEISAEDFPALPGSKPAPAPSNQTPNSTSHVSNSTSVGLKEYGLVGLLSIIQLSPDQDLHTLALGTDLTTLGLQVNSPDDLYSTFSSPWSSTPFIPEPRFNLPDCYRKRPSKTSFLRPLSGLQSSDHVHGSHFIPILKSLCSR
jgi:CCR4-NOT transcription complex subunit 2